MKKVFYLFLLIMALSAATKITMADNAGTITITSPAAGVEWVKGSTHNITWYYDYNYPVKIELIGVSSGTDSHVFTETTEDDGSYNWSNIDEPAGTYQIKITSTHNLATYCYSADFTIVNTNPNAVITIYNPAYEVVWLKGTNHDITWSDNLPATVNVSIELWSSDETTKFGTLTGTTACDGNYRWNGIDPTNIPSGVPGPVPGEYKIKIIPTDPAYAGTIGLSAPFTITNVDPDAIITIYNPAYEVEWVKGSDHDITWWSNIAGNVSIDLYLSDEVTKVGTFTASTENDGKLRWNDIDPNALPGGNTLVGNSYPKEYKILITGSGVYNTISQWSAPFTVVDVDPNRYITIYNPAYEVEWVVGKRYNITWSDNLPSIAKVSIELYLSDEVTHVGTVSNTTACDGTYSWEVPTLPNVEYKLLITGIGPYSTTSEWSAPFFITSVDPSALITIYNPAFEVVWVQGTNHNITWSDNLPSTVNVSIELWTSDEAFKVGTLTSTTACDGNYRWNSINPNALPIDQTTSNAVPGEYKIKIIPSGIYAGTIGWSAPFTITDVDPSALITIYNPAYEVEWVKGSDHDITWWSNVDGNVSVDLYLSDEVTKIGTFTASTENDGKLRWNDIDPNALPGGNTFSGNLYPQEYKILITGSGVYNNISQWSAPFTIAEVDNNRYITVYNPAFEVEWIEGKRYNITWSDNLPSIANVSIKLYLSDEVTLIGTVTSTTASDGTHSWLIPAVDNTGKFVTDLTSFELDPDGYKLLIQGTGTYASTSEWSAPFYIILDGKKSSNVAKEIPSEIVLNIYPNPATDRINITSNQNMNYVWVLNQLGKTVFETSVNANQSQLDVSGFSAGIYVVKIETNGVFATRKVMIR